MSYEKPSNMDASIYLTGCSCNCLWNEVQETEAAPEQKQTDEMSMPAKKKKHHCDWRLEGCPVAMTYTPMQPWEEPFELAKGLHAGTIFPSLRLPFRGGGC